MNEDRIQISTVHEDFIEFGSVKDGQGSCKITRRLKGHIAPKDDDLLSKDNGIALMAIATVCGPKRHSKPRSELADRASISVEVKIPGGQATFRTAQLEDFLERVSQEHLVETTFAPRGLLECSLVIFGPEANGATLKDGAVAVLWDIAFNALHGAFLHAGYPMHCLMVARSAVLFEDVDGQRKRLIAMPSLKDIEMIAETNGAFLANEKSGPRASLHIIVYKGTSLVEADGSVHEQELQAVAKNCMGLFREEAQCRVEVALAVSAREFLSAVKGEAERSIIPASLLPPIQSKPLSVHFE